MGFSRPSGAALADSSQGVHTTPAVQGPWGKGRINTRSSTEKTSLALLGYIQWIPAQPWARFPMDQTQRHEQIYCSRHINCTGNRSIRTS